MTLSEDLKRWIESLQITSSGGKSPEINTVISIDDFPANDSDVENETKENKRQIDELLSGNVGEIKQFSKEQIGNVRQVATNPFSFMTQTLLRKLKSGAGVLFIVAIAIEVAKLLLQEFFKEGRLFDLRFRERVDDQVIKFLERKEQEELRASHRSIITTTIAGLRGESLRGQIGGNFFNPERIPLNFIDPARVSPPNFNTRQPAKKSFQDVGAASARGGRRGR